VEEIKALTADEMVELAAIDNEFYCKTFFPKAFRQESPEFHWDMWSEMEGADRYLAMMVFRDGAKTTITRGYCSKRIAYATSRTILVVGKSEDAALKTLDWLRRAIQFNSLWTQTYGLEKGDLWSATHISIKHKVANATIQVVAMGIHGSVRGINLDDYRPDLIIVDDPCDEDNTLTPESRKKLSDLFFGGLKNTLAPETDMPEAKMVLLQTPLHEDDLISRVSKDPEWRCLRYSIFDDEGKSRWEARHPTATALKEKEHYINRNQLSLWLREKECLVISPEASFFKSDWLQYWDVLPEGGVVYIGIDPTPPPKDSAAIMKNPDLDDCVVLAIKYHKGKVYVINYWDKKSPLPTDIVHNFFQFRSWYKPLKVGVETFLFQRTVKIDLEKEMIKRQEFTPIVPVEDKRPKPVRITSAISERASARTLYIHRSHHKLIEQFTAYPQCSHDDVLDALAIAISIIVPSLDSVIEGEYTVVDDEETLHLLENWRR
jgi:phage terminase large subunit-like protein